MRTNSNQLTLETVNEIGFKIVDGLVRLRLVPRLVLSHPNNDPETQDYMPFFVRCGYDRRTKYRVLLYQLGNLEGLGSVNPSYEHFRRHKAAHYLAQWLELPVTVYEDPTLGIFIAVALTGNPETFLPLPERSDYKPVEQPIEPDGEEDLLVPAVSTMSNKTYGFFDYVKPRNLSEEGNLVMYMGIAGGGEVLHSQLTSNMLVAGRPQSGKSTFLRSMVSQALIYEWWHPGQVKLAFVDVRKNTFNPLLFENLPQIWGKKVVTGEREAMGLLNSLKLEMDKRADLYNHSFLDMPENLADYNQAIIGYNEKVSAEHQLSNLPLIVCFIEEMPVLADNLKEQFLSPLKELVLQGLKYGMVFVNAGQDFRAKNCDKAIVRNSTYRVMFGTVDNTTAHAIGVDATNQPVSSPPKGRALASINDGYLKEFQGLLLEKKDFIKLVNMVRQREGLKAIPTSVAELKEEELKEYLAASVPANPEPTDPSRPKRTRKPKGEPKTQPPNNMSEEERAVLKFLETNPGIAVRDLQRTIEQTYRMKPGSTVIVLEQLRARGLVKGTRVVKPVGMPQAEQRLF